MSRAGMGREQKVRNGGTGWGAVGAPSPCHYFFLLPQSHVFRDSRLPEKKRKRLLRRLALALGLRLVFMTTDKLTNYIPRDLFAGMGYTAGALYYLLGQSPLLTQNLTVYSQSEKLTRPKYLQLHRPRIIKNTKRKHLPQFLVQQ